MSLQLEAILFNHNWSSATADAFNVRKNECEYIELPEWRRGVSFKPEDSPAAYARDETHGNTLTIKVNFSFDGNEERAIRAWDANLHREPLNGPGLSLSEMDLFENLQINAEGNVLGEVTARPLMLNPGETGFQSFDLESVRLWDAGVSVSAIVWRWQYCVAGTDDWIDFAITTHRIYTVLNVPKKPWLQENVPGSTQLPWLDVLDYACEWAAGAQDTDEAATRITIRVNEFGDQGKICYGEGSAYYTDEDLFDCGSFLNLLNGRPGKGDSVNCDDCAAIVSTFANSVGCDLAQMCIDVVADDQNDFGLKPHRRIGIQDEIKVSTFGYHMVAAEGCGDDSEVFDACLKIGGDPEEPTIFSAPANLLFSNGKGGYLFRLVLDKDQDVTHALPDCKRRRVGRAVGTSEARAFRPALEERVRFDSWKESIGPGTSVFFSEFFFAKYIASFLEPTVLQESRSKALSRSIHSLWTSAGYGGSPPFRMDLYETQSWQDAREGVIKILAAVPGLTLDKTQDAEFADVVFADPSFENILFASGNLVFYLRNLCSKFGSLLDVGRDLNEKLLNPPPGAIEPLFAPDVVKRFRFPGDEGLVNSKIRIREEPANSRAPRRLYQFLSETGEVSRENGQLMYRPRSPGNHELNIFAADEQGNAVQQTLRLFVHG
jgi:hypothetical protein